MIGDEDSVPGICLHLAILHLQIGPFGNKNCSRVSGAFAAKANVLHRDARRADGETFLALALDNNSVARANEMNGARRNEASGINARRHLDRRARRSIGNLLREAIR